MDWDFPGIFSSQDLVDTGRKVSKLRIAIRGIGDQTSDRAAK
jgi:hypothetical protein